MQQLLYIIICYLSKNSLPSINARSLLSAFQFDICRSIHCSPYIFVSSSFLFTQPRY
ncbi:hypothetical protein HHK36_003398 [Tetracentron sinense]|uniref:Uncharacterized protein n=1 Tax=Tetracentron sinense TaxID=13715 RepID=A0A834ZP78_TETSI|nr:hypothetical protein HHK36_003398 [Tetracentron sinense]